jgi:DNA-binding Lrp family transcriptional regulator
MTNNKYKIDNTLPDSNDNHQEQQSYFEYCLLNNYQRNFPLTDKPFANIADDLHVDAENVIDKMKELQARGLISRVGAVFRPNTINASMLAAVAVPEERIDEVADIVNSYVEVNHNYEREHYYNLWFVLHAVDEDHIHATLDSIEMRTGLTTLRLPIIDDFHIDLGFDLQWKQ